METQKQQYDPCESKLVNTRKHCESYFEDPERGYDIRCRNRAVVECEHGLFCAECDRSIHEVGNRHRGDFVCLVCDSHFHDRNAPEVRDHLAVCLQPYFPWGTAVPCQNNPDWPH